MPQVDAQSARCSDISHLMDRADEGWNPIEEIVKLKSKHRFPEVTDTNQSRSPNWPFMLTHYIIEYTLLKVKVGYMTATDHEVVIKGQFNSSYLISATANEAVNTKNNLHLV